MPEESKVPEAAFPSRGVAPAVRHKHPGRERAPVDPSHYLSSSFLEQDVEMQLPTDKGFRNSMPASGTVTPHFDLNNKHVNS